MFQLVSQSRMGFTWDGFNMIESLSRKIEVFIMKFNKKQILDIQKNRDPFLMVDEIVDVIPGKSIVAKKI